MRISNSRWKLNINMQSVLKLVRIIRLQFRHKALYLIHDVGFSRKGKITCSDELKKAVVNNNNA